MKTIKKLIFLIVILSVFISNAQNFQGKAYYQTKRSFEFKGVKQDSTKAKKESIIDDDMKKAIKEMIRKQSEKTYILTFNKSESIYKEEKELSKPNPAQGGFMIEITDGNSELYKNTKENIYIESKEDFGKKFLIKDKIKPFNWEMTKETKMIGKYLCIKATTIKMVDDYEENYTIEEGPKKKEKQKELKITAWYTPEIPVGAGPEMYGGLPGLILELHEDKMHYVCNKIVMNPSEKIKIVAPKKGKEINQKDYDELMDKKHKEMMGNFKGNRKKGDTSGSVIFIGG